jgi:hypothetical protein
VLVLVMTLLGILFVLGIALLASMNFEADMIAVESQRTGTDAGVAGLAGNFEAVLRDTMMFDGGTPFGESALPVDTSAFAGFQVAYAEMPGVHNSFSPIEPYWETFDPANPGDDRLVWAWLTDVEAMQDRPFAGPTLPPGFVIETNRFNGESIAALPPFPNLKTCTGGPNEGMSCDFDSDCLVATCRGPIVVDADGDGIVDSVQVDAEILGLTPAQLAELSTRLNPASNPNGKVYVGLRIVPHGGLVNLNASHPRLIDKVFDFNSPVWPPNPADYGGFRHRPWETQTGYSPAQDEPALRRRGLLPPRFLVPSLLHGGPNAGPGDMPEQLYAPGETAAVHRFWPFDPAELAGADALLWPMRMEPFTSDMSDSVPGDGLMPELDRRHLVTTVSHDDLLARGSQIVDPVTQVREDLLAKMIQANQRKPGDLSSLCWHFWRSGQMGFPFEYPEYPITLRDDCSEFLWHGDRHCPASMDCKRNIRKGRLQLSLPWVDMVWKRVMDGDPTMCHPDSNVDVCFTKERLERLIHEAFFMLLNNVLGRPWEQQKQCVSDIECAIGEQCRRRQGAAPAEPFRCTSVPFYFDDRSCSADADCAPGSFQCLNSRCIDPWTGQRRPQALLSQLAASLTANMLDYADADDIPTRIALRSFDFQTFVCMTEDEEQQQLVAPLKTCAINADCPADQVCVSPLRAAGREFDRNAVWANYDPIYVYGLERQPFITEVATMVEGASTSGTLKAWAIEIYNPYDGPYELPLSASEYRIQGRKADGTVAFDIDLYGTFDPHEGQDVGPFTVITGGLAADVIKLVRQPLPGGAMRPPEMELKFENGYTLYLLRKQTYPPDTEPTTIVVDQFAVNGTKVGRQGLDLPVDCTNPEHCRFSLQRVVTDRATRWTASVPVTQPEEDEVTLGDWNRALGSASPLKALHPVELNVANLGSLTRPFENPADSNDPRNGSVAFPTTGSMLMLQRHANRPITNDKLVSSDLAFTTWLDDQIAFELSVEVEVSPGTFEPRTVIVPSDTVPPADEWYTWQEIDNGQMPLFDLGEPGTPNPTAGRQHGHHMPAHLATPATPGELATLPWGQLVFDYFTALPLSNPGPYVDIDPDPDVVDIDPDPDVFVAVGAPSSKPRVDLDGLRVQGRININAAPWKVLSGLPFIPMQRVPVAWRDRIRAALGLTAVPDTEAGVVDRSLAQSMVAYRELRPMPGTGNYNNGLADDGTTTAFGRGWNIPDATYPINPFARRGTGFMSVGELANVRHAGAATPDYRIDLGVIDETNANKNVQNFIEAAAALIALGDWVTVRSQVFTVYGVLRGEEDLSITDARLRARDVDSRALRFQETIDRLPAVLGERPRRIIPRTITPYADARND